MRRRFFNLYLKELRDSVNLATIYAVLSIGWFIFLNIQKWNWNMELVFGLSFIPIGLLPLYLLVKGFLDFRREWKDDTIYALLSLPVPGWVITLAKGLAAMTIFTVLSIVSLVGVLLVSKTYIWGMFMAIPKVIGTGWVIRMLFFVYLLFWISGALAYILSQVSYLVSQIFNRFNGIISGLVLLLSSWFIIRVADLIYGAFLWLPAFSIKDWGYINGFYYERIGYLEPAPFVAFVLVGASLAAAGAWLLNKVLEV